MSEVATNPSTPSPTVTQTDDHSDAAVSSPQMQGFIYPVASIERPDRIKDKRSLLILPISLGSERHENGHLVAMVEAINETLRDPRTKKINFAIQITDRIHAFHKMVDNPGLTLDQANALADKDGYEWGNRNMRGVTRTLGYTPAVFRWGTWQDGYRQEYNAVLNQLYSLLNDSDPAKRSNAFISAVTKDVETYHSRVSSRNGIVKELDDRERGLLIDFVVHEAAGYTIIGRKAREAYINGLKNGRTQGPEIAALIEGTGGLPDKIYRLYPGGHLNAIKTLANGGSALLPRGAEKIETIKVNIESNRFLPKDIYESPDDVMRRAIFAGTSLSKQNDEQAHHKAFPSAVPFGEPVRPRRQHVAGAFASARYVA